jgi:hypothetical protein
MHNQSINYIPGDLMMKSSNIEDSRQGFVDVVEKYLEQINQPWYKKEKEWRP